MKNSKSKSHVERLVTLSHLFSHLSFAQNSRLFVFCAMGGCSVNSLQNNCTTGTTLSDCSQPPPGTLFHKVPSSPQASPSSSVALGRIFFFPSFFLKSLSSLILLLFQFLLHFSLYYEHIRLTILETFQSARIVLRVSQKKVSL